MKLYLICPNCGSRDDLGRSDATPQDLARALGDELRRTCPTCKKVYVGDPLRSRARVNPVVVLAGVAGSLLLAAVIWQLGYVALIAAVPAFLAYQNESSSVQAYNRLSHKKYG